MAFPSVVTEDRIASMLQMEEGPERAREHVNWAMNIRTDSLNKAKTLLSQEGFLSPEQQKLGEQLFDLVTREELMNHEVQRGPEQFVVQHMPDLYPNSMPFGTRRSLNSTQNGWPFDADFIELNGKYVSTPNFERRPQVWFLQHGEATFHIGGGEDPWELTKNAQAAIPSQTPFSVEGNGTFFVLRMDPDRMEEGTDPTAVVGNFHNIGSEQRTLPGGEDFPGYQNPCPCGFSRRIWLSEKGWGFDTHLTDLGHDEQGVGTEDKFRGHQHRSTPEGYLGNDIQGEVQAIINGMRFNIRNGTLVLIPNGTMHEIDIPDGGKAEVRIYVGGGHDKDDFFRADWSQIPVAA